MAKTLYAPGAPKARQTALSWVGKPFAIGWCLLFQLTRIYKVPGLGDYDHDGDADCLDYWKAAKKRGKVVQAPTDPKKLDAFIDKVPAGALLIWSVGHGHAGFALGDGEMVGTDLPTRGKVGRHKITLVHERWDKKLEGYVVVDGNGFTLQQPVKKPTAAPVPAVYEVTTPAGLIARQGPSTKSKRLGLAPQGTKLTLVKEVPGDSRRWLVDAKKHYYSMEYLRRV